MQRNENELAEIWVNRVLETLDICALPFSSVLVFIYRVAGNKSSETSPLLKAHMHTSGTEPAAQFSILLTLSNWGRGDPQCLIDTPF